MKLYHGSPYQNLCELKTNSVDNGNNILYLTDNIVIATFYLAKDFWYTYTINENYKIPLYTEYFPKGLDFIYKNTKGSIYEIEINDLSLLNEVSYGRYIFDKPIRILNEILIDNALDQLLLYERESILKVKRFQEQNKDEVTFWEKEIINEINNKKNDKNTRYYKNLEKILKIIQIGLE